DVSRARETGGTGLGLAIAKWIADRHGGHVEVLSREGIGTRFSIVLPATMQQPAVSSQTTASL
ncbi:MAG: ATP-binding protein, partial [Bacillota bacterium]